MVPGAGVIPQILEIVLVASGSQVPTSTAELCMLLRNSDLALGNAKPLSLVVLMRATRGSKASMSCVLIEHRIKTSGYSRHEVRRNAWFLVGYPDKRCDS